MSATSDGGDHDARLRATLAWGGRAAELAFQDGSSHDLASMARLWAASIALAAGWSVVDRAGPALVVARDGARALLLPVVVPPASEAGPARAIESLLRPIFEGRSWALVLRRPIDPACDVQRIAEPTRQWIARYDQQRWDADYAIYEDVDLSVEFRMLPFAASPDGSPAIRLVEPSGEQVLDRTQALIEQALDSAGSEIPIVVVPVRAAPWRVGRRTLVDRLFGKLIEVRTAGPDDSSLSVRRSPSAWFGRPGWERVAAVWWLAPDPADPLAPRGRADENPWCTGAVPTFVGERLAVTAVGAADDPAPPASLKRVRPAFGVRP